MDFEHNNQREPAGIWSQLFFQDNRFEYPNLDTVDQRKLTAVRDHPPVRLKAEVVPCREEELLEG